MTEEKDNEYKPWKDLKSLLEYNFSEYEQRILGNWEDPSPSAIDHRRLSKHRIIHSLSPIQKESLDGAMFLYSTARSVGKSYLLVAAGILHALDHPGIPTRIFDHWPIQTERAIRYQYSIVEKVLSLLDEEVRKFVVIKPERSFITVIYQPERPYKPGEPPTTHGDFGKPACPHGFEDSDDCPVCGH